jgi:hypothetical protein
MFNLPFGPMDPHLLTETLRQQMQSPGRIPGPLAAAELKPGYRPPSGSMPSMPEARSVRGFNIDAGLDALSQGLAKWKPRQPRPADPTKPGVPTPQGDPTGGAGPAYLGGMTPLGSPTELQELAKVLGLYSGEWNPKGGFSA